MINLRKLISITPMFLVLACDKYTCLDYANCASLKFDAGSEAGASRAMDAATEPAASATSPSDEAVSSSASTGDNLSDGATVAVNGSASDDLTPTATSAVSSAPLDAGSLAIAATSASNTEEVSGDAMSTDQEQSSGPIVSSSDAAICNEVQYWNGVTCALLTVCNGEEYQSASPTATRDRECESLSHCGPGTYQTVAPTATSDRECEVCSGGSFTSNSDQLNCALWTECEADEIQTAAPDEAHDRICESNECEPDPCQNGGTCVDGSNTHTCECVDGFGGDDCENPLSWCERQPLPAGVAQADYTCGDFDEGMPPSWVGATDAGSTRSSARSSSPAWSWLSKVASQSDQGVLTWTNSLADAVVRAAANTQLNPDGLPGPIGSYVVDLICVAFGQARACLQSNGLNAVQVYFTYSGAGAKAGYCELNEGLVLDQWQEVRLTLSANQGAIEVRLNGTVISDGCKIGNQLAGSVVDFQVGASEPTANTSFAAYFDNVEAWVTRE